ncbi:MAG: DUF488 domain-containing protein [Deltaproteobacteria bacterium]|nr:DUF488 domain-containing protein [Deltaproteobacteria bacterium]
MEANLKGNIFTIGYGAQTPATLLKHLKRAKIKYVVDVRSIPYSRYQPDYSKEVFEQFLDKNGMRYVFMGDLLGGRPKDDDCYIDGKVAYAKIRSKEYFKRGLVRIINAFKQGLNICLLCSESKPTQCHRAKLIGCALSDEGVQVLHLLPNGTSCTQQEVVRELTKGQQNLFAEHFVSRKVYKQGHVCES